MKIFITGCAGFIGANFTKYWLEKYPHDQIVGVDVLTYAANLPALKILQNAPNFTFYRENICNATKMQEIFQAEKPDVVVHFAAESHVDRSIENGGVFMQTNALGTQILLDCALRFPVKRFHQISTDEVYGDLPLDSKEAFKETSLLNPSSPYSASKAAADLMALAYYKTHALPVSISRSTNNFGKYQHPEKLIPKAVLYALKKQEFPLYGNGLNVRDWLFVDDHSRAIERILLQGKAGEIYNVGANNLRTNIQIVEKIYALLGAEKSLIRFVEDRKGHDRKYALDCSKLENELGIKAQADFEKALENTVFWLANEFSKQV